MPARCSYQYNQLRKGQSGATLIIALIFLVVITLVSLNGIGTTSMEERMASNIRERNQAFQAAEVGLREAESYIDTLVSTGNFGTVNGLLAEGEVEPDYFSAATWVNASSVQVTEASVGKMQGLKEYPRYIIKYVVRNSADTDDTLSIGGYGGVLAGESVTIFKIVSRGVGGSSNSQVVLQTNYGKRF